MQLNSVDDADVIRIYFVAFRKFISTDIILMFLMQGGRFYGKGKSKNF